MRTIRAYLRASTADQNAERAKQELVEFAAASGQRITTFYIENESGATINRPELMRLIDEAHEDDVLLLEQVDRLSRLNEQDWATLKSQIAAKRIQIVALDLPTSHAMLKQADADEFTSRMLSAINGMLLDMLAAIARKDYEDRRKRQRQGVQAAKDAGKYRGRPADDDKRSRIGELLNDGKSWGDIERLLAVSRSTIAKVAKARKAADSGASAS